MTHLTFMFWNVGQSAHPDLIAEACHENDVDTLVLAECDSRSEILNTSFANRSLVPLREVDVAGSPTTRMFSRWPNVFWRSVQSDARFNVWAVTTPLEVPTLIVGVHLPSRLRKDARDLYHATRQLRLAITQAEHIVCHQHTIVLGDFNLDPFDDGMIAADGMHAMMDQAIARRGHRVHGNREWEFFYNPMWRLLGDDSQGTPGSYYYQRSGPITQYWHMFDQILIRPALIDRFLADSARVISRIAGRPILVRSGARNRVSDHLPVMVRLNLQKDTVDV